MQYFLFIFWLTNLVLWTVIIFLRRETIWGTLKFKPCSGIFFKLRLSDCWEGAGTGFPTTGEWRRRSTAPTWHSTEKHNWLKYNCGVKIFLNVVFLFYRQVVDTVRKQLQSLDKYPWILPTCQKVELYTYLKY